MLFLYQLHSEILLDIGVELGVKYNTFCNPHSKLNAYAIHQCVHTVGQSALA